MRWALRIAIVLYGLGGLDALVRLCWYQSVHLDLVLVPVCLFLWLRQNWARVVARCWNWLAIVVCGIAMISALYQGFTDERLPSVHVRNVTAIPDWILFPLLLGSALWLDWLLRQDAVIALMERPDSGAASRS